MHYDVTNRLTRAELTRIAATELQALRGAIGKNYDDEDPLHPGNRAVLGRNNARGSTDFFVGLFSNGGGITRNSNGKSGGNRLNRC